MKRSSKPSRASSALGARIRPRPLAVPARRKARVMKFGGTSVGSIERIHAVAKRALAAQACGDDVVLVVSAMAGETNRLLALAKSASAVAERRELDVIAATGEQVAVGLVALAIQAAGGQAVSILGHQLPLVTDEVHGEARIVSIGTERIRSVLASGAIPVLAGFQGVTPAGAITTLGRGGSDTSAVAIAAALASAQLDVECEIYTDVDGVFSTDPSLCPEARLVPQISHVAMLALAQHGAKVLHPRCVAIAKAHGVPVHVRSSFHDRPGTVLTSEEPLENPSFAGVALDKNVALLRIRAESEIESLRLLAAFAERQIGFETVTRREGGTLEVAIDRADLAHAHAAIEDVGCTSDVVTGIAKVTLVGSGLSTSPVVLRFTQLALTAAAIPLVIVNDGNSIRCLLADGQATNLLRALHDAFLVEPPAAPKSAPRRSA